MLVQNLHNDLTRSLSLILGTVPRWRLIQAALPYVLHATANLLHNRWDCLSLCAPILSSFCIFHVPFTGNRFFLLIIKEGFSNSRRNGDDSALHPSLDTTRRCWRMRRDRRRPWESLLLSLFHTHYERKWSLIYFC